MTKRLDPSAANGPAAGSTAVEPLRSRGQPVRFLAIGLVCWLALRAATWQTDPFNAAASLADVEPLPGATDRSTRADKAILSAGVRSAIRPARDRLRQSGPVNPPVLAPVGPVVAAKSMFPDRPVGMALPPPAMRWPGPSVAPVRPALPPPPANPPHRPILASGHELLLMSSLGMVELPETMRPAFERATGAGQGAGFAAPAGGEAEAGRVEPALPDGAGPVSAAPPAAREARWSGDGWILWRDSGAARGLVGSGPFFGARPGYGGSQAGAVLRYRLAPSSAHRPTVYVRAAAALRGPERQREVAAGLAVRPLAGLPVAVLGEARAALGPGDTRVRPAALLVSELAPQRLPFGAEAEIYAAAGYLAGRDATGFFDAQMVVDRRLTRLDDRADVRLGGGVWSGGQKGAYRVDVGPHAAVRFRLGAVGSRLAVDYRVRVAGQAQPGSGPAVTLAAGF